MIGDFSAAIGRTGGMAILPQHGNATLTVSIQPHGFLGDTREETGAGAVCRYKFFAPYNGVSGNIRGGDEIIFDNRKYAVENITTAYLGGKAVYRSGTLLLESEAEQA